MNNYSYIYDTIYESYNGQVFAKNYDENNNLYNDNYIPKYNINLNNKSNIKGYIDKHRTCILHDNDIIVPTNIKFNSIYDFLVYFK